MDRRTFLTMIALTGAGAAMMKLGGTALLAPSAAYAEDAPAIQDMVLGDANAPVTMVEYGSFTCPHCKDFHDESYKQLKADYIDTGKVKFIFREVYFDRYGLWASMMARCGGETRYFGINSMLYDQQREWAASDDPTVVVENIKKIGRTAGMDDAAIQACLEDAATAQALVTWSQEQMKTDNIQGTPTFMINGEQFSNMSYDDLKKILDGKLGG